MDIVIAVAIAVVVTLVISIPVAAKVSVNKYKAEVEAKIGNAEEKAQLVERTPEVLALFRSYKELLKEYGRTPQKEFGWFSRGTGQRTDRQRYSGGYGRRLRLYPLSQLSSR